MNIQGLASGLRAILGSVSKTVVKKTIKEIGSKSLKQIEESFTRKLSLKQQEDEDIAIAIYVIFVGVIPPPPPPECEMSQLRICGYFSIL